MMKTNDSVTEAVTQYASRAPRTKARSKKTLPQNTMMAQMKAAEPVRNVESIYSASVSSAGDSSAVGDSSEVGSSVDGPPRLRSYSITARIWSSVSG